MISISLLSRSLFSFLSLFSSVFLFFFFSSSVFSVSQSSQGSTPSSLLFSGPAVDHVIESHHSLRAPLDKSLVYWNYGGSTVITKNLIRLTPSTQDRRGFLWNEYPLESTNWEVEFKAEVFSKPHFGGDGFAMWILNGEQDPAFDQNADALFGPIFGLRKDFSGFGICFDIYDNDNRRNNPSVFVLQNPTGGGTNYNHDNDYEDNMVTKKPDLTQVLGGKVDAAALKQVAHKCVADIRNTGKTSKVLVKFLHQILHVYIDNNEGLGYKFCLSVVLDDKFKDHHIAFTAATGQVADHHDVLEITTRYLSETDSEIDDSKMARFGSNSTGRHDTLSSIYWLVVNATNIGLIVLVSYSLWLFQTLQHNRIDAVQICSRLNPLVLPHYAIHAILTFTFLATTNWYAFIFNLPLLIWRAYEFYKKNFLFSPTTIGPNKGHSGNRMSVYGKLGGAVAVYALLQIYYFARMFI